MQVVRGIDTLKDFYRGKIALALGNFDGVHLGHKKILCMAVNAARETGCRSAALVFDPHPLQVLAPEKSPRLLQTMEQRIALIGESGVDFVIVHPFTYEFATLLPEDFVRRYLCGQLNIASVAVGFNYTFGKNGAGTPELLKQMGLQCSFSVNVADAVIVDGEPVASSRIRLLLAAGEVEAAARLLGYNFSLQGTVVHGDGRGKTLGFPTANLATPEGIIHPGNGVYLTRASVAGQSFWSLTNIGHRPTFDKQDVSVEVHILDARKNLYGLALNLEFLHKIRDEKKFSGPKELVRQISRDIQKARVLLEESRERISSENVANKHSIW